MNSLLIIAIATLAVNVWGETNDTFKAPVDGIYTVIGDSIQLVGDIMVTGALKGDYSSNITLTDEGIRKLAASGRICEVLGFHCWETDWTDAFHAIYNPEGRSQSRKCRICGTNETYTGVWK